MPKKDLIEVEGLVIEALPNARFKVKIGDKHEVVAILAGKIRLNAVHIVPGDRVRLVLSPYDLTQGRITWRGIEGRKLRGSLLPDVPMSTEKKSVSL